MLKVTLCEDDPKTIKRFAPFIKECAQELGLAIELSIFATGESLLFYLMDDPNGAEIIYLDIYLSKKNGIEVAEELRDIGCKAQIIFLTSSDSFVLDAFDVRAINYLIKDQVDKDKFKNVLQYAADLAHNQNKEIFTCEYKGAKTLIPLKKIYCFEIFNRIITAFYEDKSAKFYSKLHELWIQVDNKGFARIHRSYIVNLAYVVNVNKNKVVLSNGQVFPVGETYSPALKESFAEYLGRFHIYQDNEQL